MSLANFYSNGTMYIPKEVSQIETLTSLIVSNGNNNITHTVDTTGNYSIKNQNGQSLLQFDSNANLISSTLSQAIITNTDAIAGVSNTISSLQTSVTNLQNSIGNEVGSQNLASILTIGNNAGGLNIESLNQLSANSIYLNSLGITTNAGYIVMPNVQTSQITLNNADLNTRITAIEANVTNIQNYITQLQSFFTVLSQACNLNDSSGNAFNFSNLA